MDGSAEPAWLAGQADLVGASDDQLARLAGFGRLVRLKPGQTFYEAGGAAEHVYWIVHGFLNGATGHPDGRPATVPYGGPGEGCWGSRDVFLGRPRLHRVWSTGHTDLVEVPAADFLHWLRSSPRLLQAQIRYYVDEIRDNCDAAGWQVDLDLPRRLARVLLERFSRDGFVDLPMRRDDLARLLGVSRPEVSTALGRLQRRGLLATAGGAALSVVDRVALADYARTVSEPRPPLALGDGRRPGPERVAGSAFLSGLERTELTLHDLPAGALIARRDDPVDEVFVVLDGTVSLRAPSRSGGFRLADARSGDGVLGAAAAVAGRPWPVDAVTVDHTTVVAVPRAVARARLATPDELEHVLVRVADHLAQVAVLRSHGRGIAPRIRLARLILDRAGPDGIVAMRNGGADIASEVGTSRQSMSTALADLRRAGVVAGSTRAGLRVTDAAALARIAVAPGQR